MKLSDGERHSAVRVAGKRYRLAIAPVLRADFGNYSCVSENGLGKVRGPTTRVTLTGEREREGLIRIRSGYTYEMVLHFSQNSSKWCGATVPRLRDSSVLASSDCGAQCFAQV